MQLKDPKTPKSNQMAKAPRYTAAYGWKEKTDNPADAPLDRITSAGLFYTLNTDKTLNPKNVTRANCTQKKKEKKKKTPTPRRGFDLPSALKGYSS